MPEFNVVPPLLKLLDELLDGSAAEASWMLNPGDIGLLKSLDLLTAEQASTIPAGGGASIAAHVDHLRYGFQLMNRWSHGEQPFEGADYSASWKRLTVSEQEWASRREALRTEARAWRQAMERLQTVNDVELTGVISSVAHLAYHLGAMRQIDRSTRGPSAND